MRNWFTSLNGAITLSVIALLTFLGRGFMDWRSIRALTADHDPKCTRQDVQVQP